MSIISQILTAIALVIAMALVGFLAWRLGRTERLRRRFGPEYDRALERHSSRQAAERELRSRERHHRNLHIRPLDPAARERHREQWVHIQEQFVDNPRPAVEQADLLVTAVMAERGYPTRDFADQTASLSVEHGHTLDHYRRGHSISTRASAVGDISTEDLRQAMVHYRALFDDLLDLPAAERTAEEGTARRAVRRHTSGSGRTAAADGPVTGEPAGSDPHLDPDPDHGPAAAGRPHENSPRARGARTRNRR